MTTTELDVATPRAPTLETLERALTSAVTPEAVLEVQAKLDGIEQYMKKVGDIESIRPFNEAGMRARWKLGQLLAELERAPGQRPTSPDRRESFAETLKRLGLSTQRASEYQRIGSMPLEALEAALAAAKSRDRLTSTADLVEEARPYWHKANRERRHQQIAEAAGEAGASAKVIDQAGAVVVPREALGPFPLIYADPPTEYETYSELGKERSAERHYDTLPWADIETFSIGGLSIPEVAHKDAALFMWCTSSNIDRALRVMRAWDFTFSSSAVWGKVSEDGKIQIGMGHIFRNSHELLLYGTRGNIPKPDFAPPSLMLYPRTKHSAKPPEVRQLIERMYPAYNQPHLRLELFPGVDAVPGWTVYGLPHREAE